MRRISRVVPSTKTIEIKYDGTTLDGLNKCYRAFSKLIAHAVWRTIRAVSYGVGKSINVKIVTLSGGSCAAVLFDVILSVSHVSI